MKSLRFYNLYRIVTNLQYPQLRMTSNYYAIFPPSFGPTRPWPFQILCEGLPGTVQRLHPPLSCYRHRHHPTGPGSCGVPHLLHENRHILAGLLPFELGHVCIPGVRGHCGGV